jgi:predicted transcriptional regulator
MKAKLTAPELRIMQEFWQHGRLSIREIQESFPEPDRPPYTSVQSIVNRLEENRAVRRLRRIGNAHIYEAVLSSAEAKTHVLDDVIAFFGGRAQPIKAHLVETGRLTRKDIREAEKLIVALERKGRKC